MDLYNTLFGTLSTDYCNLFFVFMLVGLLFIVINVIGLIYSLSKNTKLFPIFLSNFIMAVFTYFTHRILYSMCLASLH
jgi:hypothetical protein